MKDIYRYAIFLQYQWTWWFDSMGFLQSWLLLSIPDAYEKRHYVIDLKMFDLPVCACVCLSICLYVWLSVKTLVARWLDLTTQYYVMLIPWTRTQTITVSQDDPKQDLYHIDHSDHITSKWWTDSHQILSVCSSDQLGGHHIYIADFEIHT